MCTLKVFFLASISKSLKKPGKYIDITDTDISDYCLNDGTFCDEIFFVDITFFLFIPKNQL